jgi:D-alanine-D-alanine ligase
VLPITEIVSENDFFDYEAKYQGKSQEYLLHVIPDEMTQKCSHSQARLRGFKMKGFSRSEYISKRRTAYVRDEYYSWFNNREFDSATSSSSWNL